MFSLIDCAREEGFEVNICAITKSHQEQSGIDYPRTPWQLIKTIRRRNYDITHVHLGGGFGLRVKALMLGILFFGKGKKVLTLHSGGYVVSEKGQNASPASLAGFIFRKFDHVISINDLMSEMMRKFGVRENRLSFISPFSINLADVDRDLPEELENFLTRFPKTLVGVALLEDEYNLEAQMSAVDQLAETIPDLGLIIVGSGSKESKLRSFRDGLKNRDRVLFTGDLDRKVTLPLIKRAKIMLRTTSFDGDAMSVREALAVGTPVIATDNDMRPPGTILIDHRELTELAALIDEKLEMPKTKSELSSGNENLKQVLNLMRRMLGVS